MNKQIFENLFAAKGIKMTDQRWTVLRAVVESDDHPDAEKVLERVKNIDPQIGIATVYRTLSTLADLDIIQSHDFNEGRARYEVMSDHHHHLIDEQTGEVIEFKNEEIEHLKKKIAQELGYDLTDHKLELYGVKRK